MVLSAYTFRATVMDIKGNIDEHRCGIVFLTLVCDPVDF